MTRFEGQANDDYKHWQKNNKRIFKKINSLVKDIERDPFRGIGKPEPLKHDWSGYWSRRITDEHRLIYKVTEDQIIIASCKDHY